MTTVYGIIPAGRAPLWFVLAIALVLIGVMAIVGATLVGSRMSRFEVSDQSLRVRGDLYGRTIPIETIVVDRARAVDLRTEPSLRPRSRRMGTALPGYAAGWFRLDNGEKALLYLTDRTRVAYIPVRDGYSLLLSTHDPAGMVADLRERAKRRAG
jgi:hypothetical protein